MTVRIVIAGGRDFNDRAYLEHCMRQVYHLHSHKGIEIVSGAARGADQLGEEWAAKHNLVVHSKPPDYKSFEGRERQAPLARNEEMAAMSQVLCAFWDGKSSGTKHMIACAFRNKNEVHVFPYQQEK